MLPRLADVRFGSQMEDGVGAEVGGQLADIRCLSDVARREGDAIAERIELRAARDVDAGDLAPACLFVLHKQGYQCRLRAEP